MGFLRNMKKLLKYKTCSINHIKLCMWTSEKRKYSKAELCCNSILLRQYPSVQHWQIIFGLKWSSPIWFSQGPSIKVGLSLWYNNTWCFIWRWWVGQAYDWKYYYIWGLLWWSWEVQYFNVERINLHIGRSWWFPPS